MFCSVVWSSLQSRLGGPDSPCLALGIKLMCKIPTLQMVASFISVKHVQIDSGLSTYGVKECKTEFVAFGKDD